MKISKSSAWDQSRIFSFLSENTIPIRLAVIHDKHPLICSVWISVDIGKGASCHVGYRSCFYRSIPLGKIKNTNKLKMKFKEKKKIFDPKKIYKDEPTPTKL